MILAKGVQLSHSIDDYPEGIIVPIDKPYRWTSADVIRKTKWMAIKHFGKKNLKVGHAGTLDPLATGELLVCIGKATKLAEEFQKQPKQYIAGVSFGATTASYDLEKEIDAEYPTDGVNEEALRKVLTDFIGDQDQVAPLFSAKSVDGKRVYEIARKLYREGKPVDSDILKASRITIYDLQLLSFTSPQGRGVVENVTPTPTNFDLSGTESVSCVKNEGSRCDNSDHTATQGNRPNERIHVADISGYSLPQAEILVDCSKGTYIRALARDLGEALGSGAFLHSLRRTRIGSFNVADALSISDLADSFK